MQRILVGDQRNLNKKHKKVEKRGHASCQVSIVEENAHQETKTDHRNGVYGEIDENNQPMRVRQNAPGFQDHRDEGDRDEKDYPRANEPGESQGAVAHTHHLHELFQTDLLLSNDATDRHGNREQPGKDHG